MSNDVSSTPTLNDNSLTQFQSVVTIAVAFLGWFFGGTHMATNGLAMRTAGKELLRNVEAHKTTEEDTALGTDLYEQLNTNAESGISLEELDHKNAQSLSTKDLKILKDKFSAEDAPSVLTIDDLIGSESEKRFNGLVGKWAGFFVVAFLFGAALGGLVFGYIGDKYGRSKGMTLAILCYSSASLIAYWAQTPVQMWMIRFIVCMGVGGMWPNGVALISEAWPTASRPLLAGVLGTAANVGIFLTFTLGKYKAVTDDDWRWVMLLGASPIILAVISWILVPESPLWLKKKREGDSEPEKAQVSTKDVFSGKLLPVTIVGILLATVPLLGGWGSANWAVFWAGQVGDEIGNPDLKANVGMARSLTGIFGSFLGGWIASQVGRRRSYLLTSIICLASSQLLFWYLDPSSQFAFLVTFGILGFFSGIFFGWLPLFLPELFETRIRSTGAGVCFNFGRVLTALTVVGGSYILAAFNEDYALVGRITSWIYLLGAIGICLMPKNVGGEIRE
jgi:SHS family sialic acid transporter-like MFS transporter